MNNYKKNELEKIIQKKYRISLICVTKKMWFHQFLKF